MLEYLELIHKHIGTLMYGASITVMIAVTAILLGMALGLALCFGLLSRNRWIRRPCLAYQSLWRGTPILVQLLIVFYALPVIGLDVPAIVAATAALTMNTSAFQAEIYRGGMLTLGHGQFEAARILGIGVWPARIRILIPQMFRLVLPSLINETISILKNTSLVSIIAVTELMRVSQQIVSTNYRALEIYTATAVIYILMNSVLSMAGRYAERRFAATT